MVGVGGLFVMGGGFFPETIPQVLGALSVLLASVNVAGGFVITKRMLDMFKSESSLYRLLLSRFTIAQQDQRILLNTLGCMVCQLSCLPAVSWPRQALGWLASCRLAT
jgi:drug/metabolite transporter (DMT)-like permease